MDAATARAAIGGFLEQLPDMEPVVRTVTRDARLKLKLELTDAQLAAEIDLGVSPIAVRFGGDSEGDVGMSGSAAAVHEVLAGGLSMGAAMTRKRVLVRGSAVHLARLAPLFALTPDLYPLWLEKIERRDLILTRGPAGPAPQAEGDMNRVLSALAYAAGWALGAAQARLGRRLDVFGALAALGRGMTRGRQGK